MMSIFLSIFITLFVGTFFGYVIHWALHQTWTGKIHDAHITHHLRLYPPSDFSSETYRYAGADSTPKFFLIAAIPVVIVPVLLFIFGVLPLSALITVLIVAGVVGFLNNYLHDSFHIKEHWLSQIPIIEKWFKVLVELHYLHHVDMGTNYGIFSFLWDRVFGTYWNKNV